MHPWIKSDHPDKCTICGMDLVGTKTAPASAEGVVTLAPSQITAIGVHTTPIVRQTLTRTLRVAGSIDDDDTRHRVLTARIPGRVEQLFVTYVGAKVAAGEPLATLYSPEVLTAERIYVERLKTGSIGFSSSQIAESRERLLELGLVETDITKLEQTLTPAATVALRSPLTGTVVTKSIYEGRYVQIGDPLLEIADFSHMWFVFDAYEQDIPWLRLGQTVEITTRVVPGEVISAPIEFIDPNFNSSTRATKVRAVLPNPHYNTGGEAHLLPHRVLAEGLVHIDTPDVLTVPRSAVLDAGGGPVAYVDHGDGNYERRVLRLGRRGDTHFEVLDGLTTGESVVTEGNLLIDSQAQLVREASDHAPAHAESHPTPIAAQLSVQLQNLILATADAAEALASDDFGRYAKQFPQFDAARAAYKSPQPLPSLTMGSNLKSARDAFEPFSTAVADLALAAGANHADKDPVKIFQCPMSPVLGKGRWVQRGATLRNPFYGSDMLGCGDAVN